jgi:TetR/AcrR family transcriptional regulator
LGERFPGVAAIHPQDAEPSEPTQDPTQNHLRPVTFSGVGWGHGHAKQQPQGVHQQMALATFDPLAGVIANAATMTIGLDSLAVENGGRWPRAFALGFADESAEHVVEHCPLMVERPLPEDMVDGLPSRDGDRSKPACALSNLMVTCSPRMARPAKIDSGAARNPERTRERILSAALGEFAAKGFAGARVDVIARRAAINKRMLYHYFNNKEGLFRAVLRHKIAERRGWAANLSSDPAERLPFWFKTACDDADWIRLLEWEALQGDGQKVIDENERRAQASDWVKRLRWRQARGELSTEYDARHLALAMQSLTMYPMAFPQLTRFIMGTNVDDGKFQRAYAAFLEKFAVAFQPVKLGRKINNS